MILGIDATNIKSGGGITHLKELLNVADPAAFGIHEVIIWGPQATLSAIEPRDWLRKMAVEIKHIAHYFLWQFWLFPRVRKSMPVDILLVPGGVYLKRDLPVVVMSQNLLPHQRSELHRYKGTKSWFRLHLLRVLQAYSFRYAAGAIFLTHYAKKCVTDSIKLENSISTIIPHGVSQRFIRSPVLGNHRQLQSEKSIRLVYVSTVAPYKHQWIVAEAVALLRQKNIPVMLDLIGSAEKKSKQRLLAVLAKIDPSQTYIRYLDEVAYTDIHTYYANADIAVFASSCENMPNILLEAMASGLPIACSNRGPMPEILDKTGLYFDPENVEEIAAVIESLINDHALRDQLAQRSFERALNYTWSACARDTLEFINTIAEKKAQIICVE